MTRLSWLVAVVVLLGGCAHADGPPRVLPWVVAGVAVDPVVVDLELDPLDPYLPEPVALEEGQAATFEGVLVAPAEVVYLVGAETMWRHARGAYQESSSGRLEDRAEAEKIVAARDDELRIARAQQPRAFLLGAAAGGGLVGVVVVVLALSLGSSP